MSTRAYCRAMATTVVVFIFNSNALVWAQGFPGGHPDALGPRFEAAPREPLRHRDNSTMDVVRRWNEIAINASGLDHTPVVAGETRVFGEQFGPTRASRAMAIVHIAIFDAIIAIDGGYLSYTRIASAPKGASVGAAIAQAVHDTLSALFPSQAQNFDSALEADLQLLSNAPAKRNGIDTGHRAATAILRLRENDGSDHAEPLLGVNYDTSDQPGRWRQDPISLIPLALGARWSEVKPFVLQSASQFRAPRPPALSSREYAVAFDEVKAVGGDGIVTPTARTEEQTSIGIFWAYDGTPSLCAPPRLYNQVALQIADQMALNAVELARLLALINTAMADAAIAVWESKYHYDFWRPITASERPTQGPDRLTGGTATGRRSETRPSLRSVLRRATSTDRILRPRFRPIPPAMPGSVERYFKSCGSFTAETAFLSPSCPTNTTVSHETITETSGRSSRAVSILYQKQKRKTARAESTSASTGHLIGAKASPRAEALQTTCSGTSLRPIVRQTTEWRRTTDIKLQLTRIPQFN